MAGIIANNRLTCSIYENRVILTFATRIQRGTRFALARTLHAPVKFSRIHSNWTIIYTIHLAWRYIHELNLFESLFFAEIHLITLAYFGSVHATTLAYWIAFTAFHCVPVGEIFKRAIPDTFQLIVIK